MIVVEIVAVVKNQIIVSHNVIVGDKQKQLLNYKAPRSYSWGIFFIIILNVRLIVIVALVTALIIAIVAVLVHVQAVLVV